MPSPEPAPSPPDPDLLGSTPEVIPPSSSTALVYSGEMIAERGEMLSLTDMWTAARRKHVEEGGKPAEFDNRRPSNWSRKEGAEFIVALQQTMNVSRRHIYQGERGAGGSTYAHWQVGLAYAKYLRACLKRVRLPS